MVTKAGQSPAQELLASVSTVGGSKALLTACSRFRDIIQNSPEPLIQGAGCLCTKQVEDTHLRLFTLTEQGLGSRRCCRWTLKDVEGICVLLASLPLETRQWCHPAMMVILAILLLDYYNL